MAHMGYSLNSLKGVIWGIIWGSIIGVIKGDTRSLDNGSYGQAGLRGPSRYGRTRVKRSHETT